MLKVGLTGGICSGKTTVSDLFKSLFSIPVIDADVISRNLLQPNTPAYFDAINLFGQQVILDDQQLDREHIRDTIFKDDLKREALESIIHPRVRIEILSQVKEITTDYCLVVIPLLIEANMLDMVDRVCVVDTPTEEQIKRIQQRDDCNEGQAKKILSSQIDRSIRLSYANDIIDNNSDFSSLNHQIRQLHEKYLAMCHQAPHN